MKRIGLVRLDLPDVGGQAERCSDADVLLAWDQEADGIGAPQNVAGLHSLVQSNEPVWYRGGMETVHTAELILGLGCQKVVVAHGFFRTERMPQHFINRLGESCVVAATSQEEVDLALVAGAKWLLCEFTHAHLPSTFEVFAELDGSTVYSAA